MSKTAEDNLEQAIAAWIKAIGEEHVLFDDQIISLYSRNTLPKGTSPAAIVKPGSVDDVSSILKIAERQRIRVYPFSCGKNWGYGDACAVESGQVLIDLGRMNRILEVNTTLAYAVIEPGVTQQQLYEYLQKNQFPLWLDCTGAGPDASIVGNALERGFGHTPYGDHFLTSCGMEVVLADGRVLSTGFGHYRNSQSANVYKWGIGPYLDGLFTQSNLGVVTKLGIWLLPEPECFNAFFFTVSEEKDIHSVIEVLRPLKMQGILNSLVHVGNDLRIISSFYRYPWEETKGVVPLPDSIRKSFRKRSNFGAWNVSGGIFGTKKQVAYCRKRIKRATGNVARIQFIGNKKLSLSKKIVKIFNYTGKANGLAKMLRSLEELIKLMKGVPTRAFLFGTLWRAKKILNADSLDPLENNVGLMWLSPILPMTGTAALDLMEIVNPIFFQYKFEPLVTISLITERAMVAVISISFDKENSVETEKASQCYDTLFYALMNAGYNPYRTGIQSMNKLAYGSNIFWDVVNDIKIALDPHQIISKGRYQPINHE
ncbi:MAG: FAD-binding oxidoreductase [Candidatus Scalindua sp. AMX11]|nr:MAG: FAD-binding oxidoreductase [Candidatus Scalindua sp.]NOG85076.1 FAD-binding oxidoreductase [Planctomycetota bacterium]RZV93123.1 MAG: FAD-binding oxidoreductase [Candidatus Scalindua sp. SCAELEC01]TDE66748.1 MAG: FAD-binding oxidoreductase [Candidatus Scalindua sp. AMX11]GJQ58060.1 MAG: 4-cresol dehydrogenase [Candidatus Scalindua sp.]